MSNITNNFKRACIGIAIVSSLAACTQVPEGHVGLEKSRLTGEYSKVLVGQGNHGITSVSISELAAHQILIDIQDLKPKDKDNILLRDLDVTVAIKLNVKNSEQVIEFIRSTRDLEPSPANRDAWVVGTKIVKREASSSIQQAMGSFTSQEALLDKDKLEKAFAVKVQKDIDVKYPGVFIVESVIAQSILVSEAVENRIQQTAAALAANAQNAALETAIEGKRRLLIKEAGILKQTSEITGVSVDQLLQHNLIQVLSMHTNDTKTVINIPATSGMGRK